MVSLSSGDFEIRTIETEFSQQGKKFYVTQGLITTKSWTKIIDDALGTALTTGRTRRSIR